MSIVYFPTANHFNPRSLAGATYTPAHPAQHLPDFNPRSLAGATARIKAMLPITLFQSTLPRGSDGAGNNIVDTYARLQSTLPRGSDMSVLPGLSIQARFQSTLPRGSDQGAHGAGIYPGHFNPRSLAGATASKQITSLFI